MAARGLSALVACCTAILAIDGAADAARSETRTLSFKQLHTGETATITFKRNGRYDPEALKQINYVLRDWRRNETTTMDPKLLDLIWEVHEAVGSHSPVYVLSGYRSPVTNAMLRSRSRGVAKYSQHMLGKALDFYLPDVPLKTLRETALKFQSGGVGYYPTSGSPFVHLDTGNVRHWPRMTRQQLAQLFPDGKTLLIPADGKPMPGYNQAVAELGRTAPSQGGSSGSSSSGSTRVQVASSYPSLDPSRPITAASVSRSTGASTGSSRNLIAALFESGEDGDEAGASGDDSASTPTPVAETKPTLVASLGPAPVPRAKPSAQILADETSTAVAALTDAPVPQPKPTLVAALEPAAELNGASPEAAPQTEVAESPIPADKPLITASVASPASLPPRPAALPRAQPLMSGNDAIGMLIAQGGDAAASAPAEPDAEARTEPLAATALASTGPVAEMPPFAATFTGQQVAPRDRPALVAIDYRPEALQPYLDSDNCLRGESFVAFRHPDQTDIGALTGITGPVVVNVFSDGPQLVYPMRKFTGPAVKPVATRHYEVVASADDAVTTGSVRRASIEPARALR